MCSDQFSNSSEFKRRPWPFIKVCGIRSVEDGLLALSCGANTIGLLIGLTHKASGELDIETAKKICTTAHIKYPQARVAMVTHIIDPILIKDIALQIDVDTIQIHDDMSPENVKKLRELLPEKELLKAVHIEQVASNQALEVINYAKAYEKYVDGYLTDSKSVDPDGQLRIGGTGKRHDPTVGKTLVKAFPQKPVILAGGINDSNALLAIQEIQPAGIDANSGLANADGSKNPDKMKLFSSSGLTCPLPSGIQISKQTTKATEYKL